MKVCRAACLLVFAAALGFTELLAQETPAQVTAASIAQMPAAVRMQLDTLKDALKTARAAGDANAEAKTLNQIGVLFLRTSDYPTALDAFNAALARARAQKDVEQEAEALNGIGDYYHWQGQNPKALESFQQAMDDATASGDERGKAKALNGIGWVDGDLGQNQKALEFHLKALPLAHKVGDAELEGAVLRRAGAVTFILGDRQKAFDYVNQALVLSRQAGDRDGEATCLTYLGLGDSAVGKQQQALELFSQALPIFLEVGDRKMAAAVLNNFGLVYSELGEQKKALEYYSQALPIFRKLGDRGLEGTLLNNIGQLYSQVGQGQKALENYNLALPILREVGNRGMEATTLNNIGAVYTGLEEQQKALEYYVQALTILVQVGDLRGSANTLNNIGLIFIYFGLTQRALDTFDQALPILRKLGDRSGEANALSNLGLLYANLGDKEKALDAYTQAVQIHREVGNRDGEARTLNNIGEGYDFIGEQQKAREYLMEALPLATAVADPLLECLIFYNLMLNQKDTNPALAIFYGKQAANLLQRVRGNIQGLDKQVQADFLAPKKQGYYYLANLMIAQGRLPEAQQVLDLLKEREYSDYVRGEATDTLSELTLTPAEKQAQDDYQKSTTQLVSLGEQWAQLKKIPARTPDQEKQYQQLSDQLDAASKGLNDYYARLYLLFGKNSDANKQVADVKGDVSLLKQQIVKMPRTVALYTMVTSEGYKVIVITGATMVAREYAIPEEELNKKVAAFQQILREPRQDPKPLAQELYKILIGPVKADLDQAHAETLVWSLDGVLRYVPMAALYDGGHYLVESYNTVTITPASIPHLAEKPDVSNLSTIAMGISRKYEEGLPPLPAVVGELDDIVTDSHVQGANGVLPGTILLDGQFTEKAMEDQLGSQHMVVHIASHFVFKPGDDSQSYLLLAGKDAGGAGYHLTVADFRDNQKLALDDTDLLTFSACETGMGGNAGNGREVDGLGTTAQLKGAKAVISSLWEVNDASTGELMADFYQRWVGGAGKVEKVEALRQAQLDLLMGKVKAQGDAKGRGVGVEGGEAPTSFTHPYYWAPFVLMGNWK